MSKADNKKLEENKLMEKEAVYLLLEFCERIYKEKEDEEIRYLDTEDLLNKDFYILEENKEIEELKTEYKTTFIETEIIDKINELARAVNKLIKESEEK